MISKRLGDQAAALFLAAVAGVFWFNSRDMHYQSEFGRPGPGFFPTWLSLALLVVAGILFVRASLSSEADAESPSVGAAGVARRLLRPLLLLAFLMCAVALMSTLGFLITVGLFLATVMTVVERVSLWKGVMVAGIGTFAFYQLFSVWLGVQLPVGVILRP